MSGVKSFSVSCDCSGSKYDVVLKIGYPEQDHHPLHFQSDSLGKNRGVRIPENIMKSMSSIHALAIENNVDFPELAEYAIKNASSTNSGDISEQNRKQTE